MGSSGNQLALLQMLMPIVRPDGVTPSSSTQKLPLEQQSFEQMLSGMQQADDQMPANGALPVADGDEDDQAGQTAALMQQLGGLDRIENTALRDLLAQAGPQISDATQA